MATSNDTHALTREDVAAMIHDAQQNMLAQVAGLIARAINADRSTQRIVAVQALLRYQQTGDLSDLDPSTATLESQEPSLTPAKTPTKRYNDGEISREQWRAQMAAEASGQIPTPKDRPVKFRLKRGAEEQLLGIALNNDPLTGRDPETFSQCMRRFDDLDWIAKNAGAVIVARQLRTDADGIWFVATLHDGDELTVGPYKQIAGDVVRQVWDRIGQA